MQTWNIPETTTRKRLDLFLVGVLGHSRAQIQKIIKDGMIHINGEEIKKPHFFLSSGDKITYKKGVTEPSLPKETKKTVRIFALASFLNDLGSDIIYPIWPMFVTSVLGANMAVLGLLDGLGEALVSLSQAASGYVSDRIRKRKVFVWIGYLCGGASRIGYSISGIWQHLIPFRILDRAGKIRSAPRDAIVADISTKENRGYNFGLLRAMDNFGAVCGIVVSIVFLNILGYRKLFLLAAIPSLIGALIIFLFIKEQKVSDTKIYKGLTVKHLDRNFRLSMPKNADLV